MANELLALEKQLLPSPQPQTFMVAGFYQQANSGNVSAGIPQYLIDKLGARKIGRILKDHFYESSAWIKYEDGFEVDYKDVQNDFYFAEVDGKGLVIFVGHSPMFYPDRYATAFLNGAEELKVRRIVSISSRYEEVPFDKERIITATYSLQRMKEELEKYKLTFPTYERPEDHNALINHIAKERNLELVRMSVRVPALALPNNQAYTSQIDDYRAFSDVLRRVRYMFGIPLDLSDLATKSEEALYQSGVEIGQLIGRFPNLRQHLAEIERGFQELKFEEPVKLTPGLRAELEGLLGALGEPI